MKLLIVLSCIINEYYKVIIMKQRRFIFIPAVFILKGLIQQPLLSLVISSGTLLISYTIFLMLFKSIREEDIAIVKKVFEKVKLPENIEKVAISILNKGVM